VTGQAEQPDREVAQGGHDLGAGGGADAAGVFGEGDVADSVERFDLPVGAGQGTELLGAGVVSGLPADKQHPSSVRARCCRSDRWCAAARRGPAGHAGVFRSDGIPPRPPRCATST
jgi:hypothetical protein